MRCERRATTDQRSNYLSSPLLSLAVALLLRAVYAVDMGTRRPLLDVSYLQIPEEVRTVRAPNLADVLSSVSGKRVSRGDAIAMVLDLWAWVLGLVDDGAPDLREEFKARTLLPSLRAADMVCRATGWPKKKGDVLVAALADSTVGILQREPEGWRVVGVADRYLKLAGERAESRQRARASALAKANGWKADGNAWVSSDGLQRVEGWRALLQRLEQKHSGPGVEGVLQPLPSRKKATS